MPKRIEIQGTDLWDEELGEFISVKDQVLVLEHSLISVSKWEQKWKKSFFLEEQKPYEELMDYIRCMTINQVDEQIYKFLTPKMYSEIDAYINDPMTATTFSDARTSAPHRHEIITSEIIYYNMISFGIPVEFEKWHLNRLMALIRVFSIKNGGEKKMSKSEAGMYQKALNEKRRASARAKHGRK